MANRKRAWTWALIIIALALIILFNVFQNDESEVVIGPFYEANQSHNDSSGNSPNQAVSANPGGGIENGSSETKQSNTRQNNSRPLSAKQIELQLAQARSEVEEVKRLNQQRKAKLEQTMSAERAELESLLKVDIGYHVENWRKAWQAGDFERYLSFYSKQFKPRNDLSFSQWRELRKQRVIPTKKIALKLANFKVEFSNGYNQSTVSFDQSYAAGTYQDTSRKQLLLVKEKQEWRIVSETEIQP